MTRPAYIASDVHLGAVPRETERAFLRFLEHVGSEAGSLLLAGDLFDFWFEYGPVVPGRHFRVLAALADLVGAGIPVTLAGGNHDWWGGRFLREEIGLDFRTDPFRTTLAGRTALVAHGDGLGGGDLRYRALRAVIRSRAVVGLFRALHPEVGVWIARRVSRTEIRAQPNPWRAGHIAAWARERLAEDPGLALVVCGHAHLPAIEAVGPGRWYLNAGDWLTHYSYIMVAPDDEPVLQRWEPAG
jgi:UDP-2,3-diacylglucosamine hydrolase